MRLKMDSDSDTTIKSFGGSSVPPVPFKPPPESSPLDDSLGDGKPVPGNPSAPLAVFVPRANSHPFTERRILVTSTIKIGRSVARLKPEPGNAIFDCKVLSRNHALLWYEGNKFFLQDTQSSNGTFVNGQQIGKTGSDDSPNITVEIYSGEVIQFGVNVMENAKRVTHGCILTTISLYHPNGKECLRPTHETGVMMDTVSGRMTKEWYQLSTYVDEAVHREQMLEAKLVALQNQLSDTQVVTQDNWKVMIDEERLLSRLEMLEEQLQVYSKLHSEDTLRTQIVSLYTEREEYEQAAKESVRRILDEKFAVSQKLCSVERNLSTSEDECGYLRNRAETAEKDLQELAEKHQKLTQEHSELTDKHTDLKLDYDRLSEQKQDSGIKTTNDDENKVLEPPNSNDKININTSTTKLVNGEISSDLKENGLDDSTADVIPLNENLLIKNKSENKETNKLSNNRVDEINSQLPVNKANDPSFIDNIDHNESDVQNLRKEISNAQDEISRLNKLKQSDQNELMESRNQCVVLRDSIDSMRKELNTERDRASDLNCQLAQKTQTVENKKTEIQLLQQQLIEKENQFDSDQLYISKLREAVENLEVKLSKLAQEEAMSSKADDTSVVPTISSDGILPNSIPEIQFVPQLIEKSTGTASEENFPTDLVKSWKEQNQRIQELTQSLENAALKEDSNNLTDREKEAKKLEERLNRTLSLLEQSRQQYEDCLAEKDQLQRSYEELSYKSTVSFYTSAIPLFILILAILTAFYLPLARFTGTLT